MGGNHIVNKSGIREKFDQYFPIILIYELVLGGSGRVLVFPYGISIRYLLFGVSITYYVYTVIDEYRSHKGTFFEFIQKKMNRSLWLGLFFMVLLAASILRGFRQGYPLSDVFQSSKGMLFLLMLFPFSYFVNSKERARALFRSFTNASVILASISVIIFLVFGINNETYNFFEPFLSKWSYGYIALRNGFPAVFMKTSPYIAIALIIELGLYINSSVPKNKVQMFRVFILLGAVICTMSMGIWISTAVGFIGMVVLSVVNRKYIKTHNTRSVFIDLLPMILLVVVSQLIFNFAFNDYIVEVIDNRINTGDSSFVVKADQLTKLTEVWKQNIFFGKGFGHRIYFSLGEFREESMIIFELFWNQLLLNMGLLGFASYVYLIIQPVFNYVPGIFKRYYKEEDVIFVTLISIGMLMMAIVSSVNPFMNNPIGIGYLSLFMASVNIFARNNNKSEKKTIA